MTIRSIMVLLLLLAATSAKADIISQLDNSTLSGNPGDTLTFDVTLTNTSFTDQIWLNGISSTASSDGLKIDTSLFYTNAPLFLDPETTSADFPVFEVTIDSSQAPGPYIGSFVSVFGGADGGAGSAFDDLVDISFDVNVAEAKSNTAPEPANWLLMLSAPLLLLRLRR